MRIQHNIMAMNAYRNYTNNVSAMKSNLEKLSSGYKINRAGDDAAGLAISEKMRAQITGLETAQKNAKDGISLVQTAEGALTEVHDMLNRMVELATQSSNGTYDNTTDRAQLQKELDQLRTEIDRIADSSNFNGINLLDGSMAVKAAVEASTTTSTESVTGMDRIITSVIGKGEKAYEVAGEKTILDGKGAQATKAKFEIDLKTLDFAPKTGGSPGTWTMSAATATSDSGYKFKVAAGSFDKTSGTIKVTIATSGGTDKLTNVDAAYVANGSQVTVTYTPQGSNASPISVTFSGVAFASASNPSGSNFTLNIAGKEITTDMLFPTASATSAAIASMVAQAIVDKITAGGSTVEINGVDWTVTASNGKLKFEQTEVPETADEARANFDVRVSIGNGATGESVDILKITLASSVGEEADDVTMTMAASIKAGTYVATAGVAKEDANKANTIFNINQEDIGDGTQIAIGTKTVVLSVGANSQIDKAKYTAAGAIVVELDEGVDLNTALSKISEAIGSTVNFKILDASGNEKLVKFQIGVSDNALGFPTGLAVQRINTVGAGSDSGKDLAFDSLEKLAKNFAMNVTKTTTTEAQEATKGLKLQIGDTADPYNQLVVSINDCHADAIGIGDIDISTQEGAEAAVKKIKDAINYVSDVRGTLGATQNRLDHTINNLSVMTENIQDAESTIRDVDVAEEMMAYTKNNILIQSAQAMLAQANQVPQGVLQLLQ